MIDGLKPYPAYKDSGLPWLGRLPSHWQTKRGKALFAEAHLPVRAADEIVTCFRDGQVTLRRNRRTGGFMVALYEVGYQGVRKGQLVIHTMDAFAGAIGVSDSDGKCTPEYIVCYPRSSNIVPTYYSLALRIAASQGFILASCPAVRERAPRFRYPHLGDMQLPLPAPEEQAAIVRFLNHVNGKIERAIRAKRKMIALLNEQVQAIIHRAVTRGLNPTVKLKPSGIPWLGDMPEHWQLCRLRNVVDRVTSGSRGWSAFVAAEGPLFIRVANLRRLSLRLRFDDTVRLKLPATSEAIRARVHPGDLLVSITAYIGSIAVVPDPFEEAYVSQHVACCRPRDGSHNSSWIGYVLLSEIGQTHGRLSLYGGTKDGLSLSDVKDYPILLPPRPEQDQLVKWIEAHEASLASSIEDTERKIQLLREYRTRLTADVVAGKLDVREAVKLLPLESVEQPPVDDQIEEELDDTSAEAEE